MKMRLTGNATSSNSRMYGNRLAGKIRTYPKLAVSVEAVVHGWATLVGSFCVMIDPYLSRYLPDLRLVAVMTKEGDLELHRVSKGIATRLGMLLAIGATEKSEIAQAKWTNIELRMPPDQLWQRTLSLPAASRDFLAPIIEHRLERLTPWHPDRVLYGFRVCVEAERGTGLVVSLTATSKDFVSAPLQALGAAGLAVTAVGPQCGAVTEPLSVNILHGGEKAARVNSRRVVSRVALVFFGLLAVLYLASFFWLSAEISDKQQAEAKLLTARRLLNAVSIGAVGDRERLLLDAKQPSKSVVVLLDKLATAIPTNTFLKELAITPDKVRLLGVSGDAPALVRVLESIGLVNIRFTSAVMREDDQRDSFEITADRAARIVVGSP